ncbi:UNVERIFIED_CONTAM: hypothetical protein K2H54_021726 [Gekko kuhli]
MAWILLLLLKVLTCFSGALSDYTLSQPPSLSVSLEGTAKLPCNISGGYYFKFFVWYQHMHGTSPKFLLNYNTTSGKTVFGSEVSDRFSVSTDAPKYVGYLNINNAQAKDEADYYCGMWGLGSLSHFTLAQTLSLAASLAERAQVSCRISTLISSYGSSFAQYVLTQPPSVSVSLEQNAQITCSGNDIGRKYVHWYQQKPSKAPVLIIYDDSRRPEGISDRFSGSSSGNRATLSITRAIAEDEADYYCQAWDSNKNQRHSVTDKGGISSSQLVLTQESSMSASLGQTVKLSCSMSSGYPVQNDDQSWYQQKPGSPPKFLVYYYSSPRTGSGDLSRFSSSKESSQNIWYLTISNVQAEDEADYYCAVQYETPYTFHSDVDLRGTETKTKDSDQILFQFKYL